MPACPVQLLALREGSEAEVTLAAQRLARAQADAAHAAGRMQQLEAELAAAAGSMEKAEAKARKKAR